MNNYFGKELIDCIAQNRDCDYFKRRLFQTISKNPFACEWRLPVYTGHGSSEALNVIENWQTTLNGTEWFTVHLATESVVNGCKKIIVIVTLTDEGNKLVKSMRQFPSL